MNASIVSEKERSIAARRLALQELRAQVSNVQNEYNTRKSAFDESSWSVNHTKQEVDQQWADREAFMQSQSHEIEEALQEERGISETTASLEKQIERIAESIDLERSSEEHLSSTDTRIVELERQLEADDIIVTKLERMINSEAVASASRVKLFDKRTGSTFGVVAPPNESDEFAESVMLIDDFK